jgi:hypothetical protein
MKKVLALFILLTYSQVWGQVLNCSTMKGHYIGAPDNYQIDIYRKGTRAKITYSQNDKVKSLRGDLEIVQNEEGLAIYFESDGINKNIGYAGESKLSIELFEENRDLDGYIINLNGYISINGEQGSTKCDLLNY